MCPLISERILPSLLSAGCLYKDEEKGWKEEADHDTPAVRALDMETKAAADPGSLDVGFRLARRPGYFFAPLWAVQPGLYMLPGHTPRWKLRPRQWPRWTLSCRGFERVISRLGAQAGSPETT